MKSMKYILCNVAQCINIELSTDEATRNSDEAFALYFEDDKGFFEPVSIENVRLGGKTINA